MPMHGIVLTSWLASLASCSIKAVFYYQKSAFFGMDLSPAGLSYV